MKLHPQTRIFLGMLALLLIGSALIYQEKIREVFGGQTGITTRIATTSNPTVGTSAVRIFATSTCSGRIISTTGKAIMLTFTDAPAQVPTATFGHIQAASTTVVYDASEYGCNAVRAYGFDANSSITVSETR